MSRIVILTLLLLAIPISMQDPANAQIHFPTKRQPRYAGSWYEGDGIKLDKQISDYMSKAQHELAKKSDANNEHLLAIIVPHAGFVFSGQTAAYAYQALSKEKVKRIFLLGPSHHVNFHGLAVPESMIFNTPLGELNVDKEVISELKNYPLFGSSDEAHNVEHSLEMQLPFIYHNFKDVKIVPIVVGSLDEEEIRFAGQILKSFIAPGDAIVISSDFTHYGPRYDYQPFKSDISANISKMDMEALDHLSKLDLSGFLKFQHRTQDTICGMYPCAILCALLPENSRGHLLKYATSADSGLTKGDPNSVSYLAIAFTGKEPWSVNKPTNQHLNAIESQALLKIARATLEAHVKNSRVPKPEELGIHLDQTMKNSQGAFVTLYKVLTPAEVKVSKSVQPHSNKELRGCIGTIWPVQPLWQAVQENAISASSRDPRFERVTAIELPKLQIEISVLTPPKHIASYKEIVLGRDGIILAKHGKQAVFLPFVATEFGWDLKETLTQLALKAGLNANDWQEGAAYEVFQAQVIEEKH